MVTPSKFNTREYYLIKYQTHNTDTTTYMEALSGENTEEYFKVMDDEIQNFMIRDTWEIFLRRSFADHNVLPGTWYFKCKRKHDWTISKFKSRYCVIGHVHKIMYPEPLDSYYPVVQLATVRLME